MPILRRDDGIRFAVQTYRESLTLKKASLLRNEVRILAQEHGEYLRFFPQSNKQIEAVFSSEPGYLLAESVWYHFGKPNNLVYCEKLPDKQIIIVVVSNGIVYLDAVLPEEAMREELKDLLEKNSGNLKYDIYAFGDVPISADREIGKYFFQPNLIKSFNQLDESVFSALQVNPNLELQSLALALTMPELRQKNYVLPAGVGIVAIALIGIWYYATQPAAVAPQPATLTQAYVDPFGSYKSALATPAPAKQLDEMASVVRLIYDLPAWQANQITYNGSNYVITVTPSGGSRNSIIRWANQKNLTIELTPAGATLTLDSHLAKRPQSTYIYDIQQVVSLVLDRLNEVLPDGSVSISNINPNAGYKTASLSLSVASVSPEILMLIGRQLANLPVSLNSITISIQQDGLLSGTIQLTALGS